MPLELIIGNKNYSSWSLRPWIAMKTAGIPFEETVISLDAPEFKARVGAVSGTGKVPVLVDGDLRVWESLAILEYLAERFPAAGLWPSDPVARAQARVLAAEMHAGFVPLRRGCPMNMWHPPRRRDFSAEVQADIGRIDALWTDCLNRSGGPFLFGAFSAADAMYAPVVSRFETFAIDTGATSRAYRDAVMALPAWSEWRNAALREPWVLARNEPDWPDVPRLPPI
jgi:glutathione S-transferase